MKRATILSFDFLMPRPSLFLGLQILFHAIVEYIGIITDIHISFLFRKSVPAPPYSLQMHFGILYQFMEYYGISVKFNLIRMTLPAAESVCTFHPASFCLIVNLISSRSALVLYFIYIKTSQVLVYGILLFYLKNACISSLIALLIPLENSTRFL